MNRTLGVIILAALVAATSTAQAEAPSAPVAAPGNFTATVGAGLTVGTPFVELQLGRRFAGRAHHVEAYLDYSYDAAVSTFAFHTGGLGVRTYLRVARDLELFHQALAGFAISAGGYDAVQDRAIGERLLGPFFTQGIGAQYALSRRIAIAAVAATGYPVWLRPELTVRVAF